MKYEPISNEYIINIPKNNIFTKSTILDRLSPLDYDRLNQIYNINMNNIYLKKNINTGSYIYTIDKQNTGKFYFAFARKMSDTASYTILINIMISIKKFIYKRCISVILVIKKKVHDFKQ